MLRFSSSFLATKLLNIFLCLPHFCVDDNFSSPNFVCHQKRKKLFKYLLARRINIRKSEPKRLCHHHHQRQSAAAHQKYHFNFNDYNKYLSRFCVWLKWREEVKFKHLYSLFSLNASGRNNWKLLTEKVFKSVWVNIPSCN